MAIFFLFPSKEFLPISFKIQLLETSAQKQKEQRQKQQETVSSWIRLLYYDCRIWRHADPDTGETACLFFNWMCGKKYCCEENTCSLCICTNTPDVILEIRGMSTVQKAPNVLRVFYYTCLINILFLNIHVYWRIATQSCVSNIFVYLWEECLLATCLLECVWQLCVLSLCSLWCSLSQTHIHKTNN